MTQADQPISPTAPPERASPGREAGAMQLISRAAAVLRALEGQQKGLSLGQIAKATGLPRPTVQRIVDALVIENFLAPDTIYGGVRLGSALMRIASSGYSDFRRLARPHLESLGRRVQETIVLTAFTHGRLTFVDQVLPDRPLQIVINPSLEVDPVYSATGKAHLAAMTPEELERWLPPELDPPTPRAVATIADFLKQLEEIRETSIAVDLEERTEGSCALATTLEDTDHTTYAITLITTSARYLTSADAFRQELITTRDAILHTLGVC